MATRMTTVLYGDEPGTDVAPGNRVDVQSASGPDAPAPPPMRPIYPTPTPTPWVLESHRELVGPRGLRVALGVAAASLAAACVALITSSRRALV
jgi:hypothetical protein